MSPLIFSFSFLIFSIALALLLGLAGFLGGGSSLLGEVDIVDVLEAERDRHVVEIEDQFSIGAEEVDFVVSGGVRRWSK